MSTHPTSLVVSPTPVITRFAPSPTGHLHIGGARSALFCWAYAKSRGGRFMVRIEDTDAARSSDESARGILDDLAWLGIEWDDGPAHTLTSGGVSKSIATSARDVGSYFQARRVHFYNAYITDLVSRGLAYPAFDTVEETEAQRAAAAAAKKTYRYPRPSDITRGVHTQGLKDRWARANAGERHVIRFVVPHESIIVHDRILGDVKLAAGELDDFVIRKPDGLPTYHFAVVIDDELMGVTDVMRAQEHLANTPRHVALQHALVRLDDAFMGHPFRTPTYAHMPIICNMDGSKMSKRDKAKVGRKALKDAITKDASITPALIAGKILAATKATFPEADIAAFIAADNDSLDIATAFGVAYSLTLPEIEVWDFRANGYLPEAICNFVALLGWNPGLKTHDGKDLEKFDMPFIASHFTVDRVGKTNSKFDRAKLLSFNADAMVAMGYDALLARWIAWANDHEPLLGKQLTHMAATSHDRTMALVRAITPRAKTLRDLAKSAAFALVADDVYFFDPVAAEKNLIAENYKGLSLVREVRTRLEALDPTNFTNDTIHVIIEQLAQQNAGADNKPAMSLVSQALRVALTGTTVSPGIGETLAVLGKASALARLTRCIDTFAV